MTYSLVKLGTNATVIKKNGKETLFSYETPVAIRMANGAEFMTSTNWSKTTNTHINQFLNDRSKASVIPQEELDKIK
jgi:hypothetical protein